TDETTVLSNLSHYLIAECLPKRQAHIVQPHGERRGVDVSVELENSVQAAGGDGVERHAQGDDGPGSVVSNIGEDHVASRIAFDLPDRMVPCIGRSYGAWHAGCTQRFAEWIPNAPHFLSDQQPLHVVAVAIPAGALANSELERLCRGIVYIKG